MLTHLKQVDTSSEAAKVALQVAVSAGGVLRTNLVARTSDILSSRRMDVSGSRLWFTTRLVTSSSCRAGMNVWSRALLNPKP